MLGNGPAEEVAGFLMVGLPFVVIVTNPEI